MANGSAAKAPTAGTKGEGFFARILRSLSETKAGRFLKESKIETIDKASWPTQRELKTFTLVVLFALGVVGGYIAALDAILRFIIARIPGNG